MMKKILIISGSVFFAVFGTLQAKLQLEIPYNSILIKYEDGGEEVSPGQYHFSQSGTTYKKSVYDSDDIDMNNVGISVIVQDPETKARVVLERKVYGSRNAIYPHTTTFNEQFAIKNKNGKITYTVNPEFHQKNGKFVVKSIIVKILHAELEGVELSKHNEQKTLPAKSEL